MNIEPGDWVRWKNQHGDTFLDAVNEHDSALADVAQLAGAIILEVRKPATLTVAPDGTITGTLPCGHLTGSARWVLEKCELVCGLCRTEYTMKERAR